MSARKDKARKTQHAPSSGPYEVDMTETCAAVYKDLYRKAKDSENRSDYTSSHRTTFEMVRDVVKRVIPNDPLNKKYALSGGLANMFRIRKGRMRICWIASSRLRRVCIVFISETLRKEGDPNDPYVILQNMVDSGTFDSVFSQFGVRVTRLRNQSLSDKPH